MTDLWQCFNTENDCFNFPFTSDFATEQEITIMNECLGRFSHVANESNKLYAQNMADVLEVLVSEKFLRRQLSKFYIKPFAYFKTNICPKFVLKSYYVFRFFCFFL